MQLPEYMTTAEVSTHLRLKERTIYEMVARKAIPCSRATGKLLFPRRLIDRWIEANLEMQDERLLDAPPIVAGSSDPLLEWALRESKSGLATLFEGSAGGLKRFVSGEATAVGIHIYDGAGGGYNVDAVRALGSVTDVVLVAWAEREQGLVLPRGNPRGLTSLEDAVRSGVRWIRRQSGAGAQILFEELLKRAGLTPGDCAYGGTTALTEADVAAAIADGQAECGLAIGAVARRFGLEFIPLHVERFDIACRRRSYFEPPLQALFGFARTERFQRKAGSLGHYGLSETGGVRFNA